MGNIVSIESGKCFRFLDLPAELRNDIYILTLTHNRVTGSKATPALLRTCRKVHNEAIDILYAESTLCVAFDNHGATCLKDCELAGDVRSCGISIQWFQSGNATTLPLRMAQIKHLYFYFYDWSSTKFPHRLDGTKSTVHEFLKVVVRLLGQSTYQRSILCVLQLEEPARPELLDISTMFEPLYRLPTSTMIRIESEPTHLWPLGILRWLGGTAARHAARVDDQIRRKHEEVEAILERDVRPRLASRLGGPVDPAS